MIRFEDSRVFDASRDLVWRVVSDPEIYAEVAPNLSRVEVLTGEGEGMVRECADADGRAWTETCTAWEAGHRYAVAVHVADSPVHRRLFHSFAGEWRVEERDEGVLVTMRFDFEPRYGPLGWAIGALVKRGAPELTGAILEGWAEEIAARRAAVAPAE